MSLISITDAQSEVNLSSYTPKYLKWKGYYDQIPLLRSTINAVADSTAASWSLTGDQTKEVTKALNNIDGNGKETFKTLMVNAIKTGMICGDAFFEIVTNDDLGIENLVMLPSNNIRIVIKNGRIKRYEEITAPTGESAAKWKPEEIFHYTNNQIGSTVHGTSDIEPLQNLLIYLKQVQTDLGDIMHNYAIPKEIVEVDTDDPTEMQKWKDDYMSMKNRGYKIMFVPKGTVEAKAFSVGIDLDPSTWHRLIVEQILASMRVPDLALATGTVNSEESGRIKYSGFRQLIRMKSELLSEQIERQIFPQINPEPETPIRIEFSFAAEPQEERFNRLLSAFTTVSNSPLNPDIKGLLLIKILQDSGMIKNE